MMTLHQDKDAFRVLISDIHDKTGYRVDVLEKDYYITLVLNELAEKQRKGLLAYFKGGTALYKALKTIRRFSEDIDLSVDNRGRSRTQSDKMLRQATKEYNSVEREANSGPTNRSEVIATYTYIPEMEYDKRDALQRFGRIKVEATSFTISEPFAPMEVTPLLFDAASKAQKQILSDSFGVRPFDVLTMTIERIFVDKLFAAEAYTRNSHIGNRAFDAAKHIYDLCVLMDHPSIQKFIMNEEELQKIIDIRVVEEKGRLDGIPGIPFYEFTFFSNAMSLLAIQRAYELMQRVYIFKTEDRISQAVASEKLCFLASQLSMAERKEAYTDRISLVCNDSIQWIADEHER